MKKIFIFFPIMFGRICKVVLAFCGGWSVRARRGIVRRERNEKENFKAGDLLNFALHIFENKNAPMFVHRGICFSKRVA